MKHSIALLAILAFSLAACGDDDVTPPVIVVDAGGGVDMNVTPVDMGHPDVDMGPACAPANIMPLPAAALPRCAVATQTAVAACGLPTSAAASMCIGAALAADTTAAFDAGGGQTIDCGGCYNLQQVACLYSSGCDTQLDHLLCCAEANGCADPSTCAACDAEYTAVTSCAPAHLDCFTATTGMLNDCFGATTPVVDGGTPATDGGAAPDAA